MLDMVIHPCPFERRVIGFRGQVLLRRHPEHVKASVEAIGCRDTPAWSAGPGGRTWRAPRAKRTRKVGAR